MKLGKRITIFLILVTLFFLWNYVPFYFAEKGRRKERQEEKNARAEYIPYVNEISGAFGRKMREKLQLIPTGQLGIMNSKIETLHMEFTAYRRATIEEARAMQLLVMDQYLKAIHAHKKIQPFLKEQPFSNRSIRISINYKGPHGYYCDGSVARIANTYDRNGEIEHRNKIYYMVADPYENETTELFEESYIDALKIITASTDSNPFFHKITPLENAIDPLYASFIDDMKKNHHLLCWSIGGKMPSKLEEFSANFNLIQHTSQEEARKLLLTVAGRLIETLNTSKELNPHLIEYPFPTNRLKLHINFTRSNYFNYYDGSTVSITLENDKITYFKILPEDTLARTIPFYEESFQEAQSLFLPASPYLHVRSK